MANLAKVITPSDARRRGTNNRDYTLPARRNTDAPNLEVNAPIRRPSGDAAEELRKTLGLVADAAGSLASNEMIRREQRDEGDAIYDAAINNPDDERFRNSRAYRRAYVIEGAKRQAFQIDLEVVEAVQNRLADEDNPATLGDIERIVESRFAAFGTDPETGKIRNFGDPDAARAVAQQLTTTRQKVMGVAYDVIRDRTNERTLNMIAGNAISELLQGPPASLEGAPPTLGTWMSAGRVASLTATSIGKPTGEATVTPTVSVPAPTGRLPVSGRTTSGFGHRAPPIAGASANHRGMDIAAGLGSPVEAPAYARVVKTGRDKSSGNYVVLSHGKDANGREIRSSYAHLGSYSVKEGDVVQPGDNFAKVGQTGRTSGPHLHYSVSVGDEKVNPEGFDFSKASGVDPQDTKTVPLSPAGDPRAFGSVEPPVSFETLMERVPNSIPREQAKKYLLQTFLTAADAQNRPEWLEALWRSERPDGTPSFNPDEIKQIRQASDAIRDRMRVEEKRKRNDRYEANEEILMSSMAQGQVPTQATIRQWESEDRISGRFASALLDHIDADQRRDDAEARAAQREADRDDKDRQRETDNDLDVEWASEAELRRSGVLTTATLEEDQRRLDSGELGTGKRAIARYRMLRAAARQGEQELLRNPEVAVYAERITREFKPLVGSSRVAQSLGGGTLGIDYSKPIIADYRRRVRAGETPSEAYEAAKAAYGPKPGAKPAADPRRARREELLRKRDGR
ncbi:M23 family metallopeptidase [Sphingomonas sp. AOB5]|uniref:M23 family metallopeptidase n=1 Tax=Sphingomonas sp. AOB5 TaxID=3034017 RepID=UPI0023F94C15|nr:M23 family metallopeptidase [Sphingomonas sp. AOB5]MDF7775800.1 M23 family metallopeptidase [Sphingomonas sp. AOB5]